MELSTCDSRFGRVQNRLHRFDCLYDALTGTMTYALVYFDSNGREHRHRFPSVFHGLCDQLDGDVRMYFACKGAYLSLFSRMNATLCSLCQSVGLWLLSLMLCIYLVFFSHMNVSLCFTISVGLSIGQSAWDITLLFCFLCFWIVFLC